MKTRTIIRNAVFTAAAAGATVATVGLAAGTASASTVSGSTHHGHPQLTPMTGPLSHEAEIATVTTPWWQHAGQPYALTDAGRTPVLEQLRAGWRAQGHTYAPNQDFTQLHNSAVTELAFGQRSYGGYGFGQRNYGGYEVLTEQGGRLAFEPLNSHGAAADQLWTWTAGTSPDSWSFQNVATGQYLTAGRHGSVGISNQPYVWQQIELPAA
jgi:hypothetical protein